MRQSPNGARDRVGRWVRTHCQMCYSQCAIQVHVRDGVALKIEGDPTNPLTRGRICARGQAGLMKLYDPYRVKAPLVRTNPRKGRGVDPCWRQVTWDEALDLVGGKLAAIRQENPHKLLCGFWSYEKFILAFAWCLAYGTDNGQFTFTGVSSHCANPIHLIGNITHGSQADYPDLDHCRYLLVLGSGIGATGFNNLVFFAQRLADARERGMRLVVVDPRLSPLAAKADEWLPIVPGTDLALLLAMLHVLVNEEGRYDAEFLRRSTNAPYLVDGDGRLVRDVDTGEPLVWDEASAQARQHDDADLMHPALDGGYEVEGLACRPAFALMRERFAAHPPEVAAPITGIAAESIRRLARELGQAAQIGAVVQIDGERYPYRPASAISYRGMQSHTNGTLATMALEILNAVLGSLDAVGGTLARSGDERRYGCPPPRLAPGKDGLPVARIPGFTLSADLGFPPRTVTLKELFPLSIDSGHLAPPVVLEPERYGLEAQPEALLLLHTNPVMSAGEPEVVMRAMERLFVVDITLHLDETAEFADVILPESSYLERYNLVNLESDAVGLQAAQPVVEPLHDTREAIDVLIDLAARCGCLYGPGGYNALLNGLLQLCPDHKLDTERRYTWVELLDTWARCRFGDDRGLDWLREHGHYMRQRTPAERYRPTRWGDLRVPVYYDFFRDVGDRLRTALDQSRYEDVLGFRWDMADYAAVPYWRPSPIHGEDGAYDLYCINYKTATTTSADGVVNPWLMEVNAEDTPYLEVEINAATARARGIRDGDRVRVESRVGAVAGRARLTEGLQAQTVGIAAVFGRWMSHPVAAGRGSHHNALLPLSIDYTDKISGNIEACARVRMMRL
ncbi:MAG: molybdopterin-dependent oxidoreductase [Chloroflexi bacterium]|nr:molybdopterin-dependent oxidoreductase [Chloroflexota bacterium]